MYCCLFFCFFAFHFLILNPRYKTKGVLNLNHHIQPVYHTPVASVDPTTYVQQPEIPKEDFTSELFLPPKLEQNDISIEKPEIDMREMSIDSWRKDTETKNNKVILNDLRSYQDEYNNLEKNDFKNISIDEHNQQNIKEWEQRIRDHTNGQMNNI